MSDDESENENQPSLDDVQLQFKTEIGHAPHTVKQMLHYCKQQKNGYKFSDINKWWPSRSNPEKKKAEKAVNADDYKEFS